MSRPFVRISLLLAILFSGQAVAIGLGEIRLESALNEPLRAEIVLLSATADELNGLRVAFASAEDFERYGIDRPFYLQEMEFSVVRRGVNDSVVQVRSRSPITEPFLTFLVEATWSSGRLLREYTVLLDPPTYTPPGVQRAPAVEAPVRSTPADSAPIERRPPPSRDEPVSTPAPRPAPQPTQPARAGGSSSADSSVVPSRYDRSSSGSVNVQSGDTLWGIAHRHKPDSRLNTNQTMMAIYEANKDAFNGNINSLRSGVTLRIPSADDIFQISRNDAFAAVSRQNEDWGYQDPRITGADDPRVADSAGSDTGTSPDTTSGDPVATGEPADSTGTEPSLTLVPPDEEPATSTFDDDPLADEPYSREREIEDRIAELEAAEVPNQQSLIEIRDNELAALRQELADIRGEVYEPPPADEPADVEDPLLADDLGADDAVDEVIDDQAQESDEPSADIIRTSSQDKGVLDTIIEFITGIGWIIGLIVLAVLGLLIWFMRRGDDDDFDTDRPWETLDGDDSETAFNETLRGDAHDESIVVVEQDTSLIDDTVEAPSLSPEEFVDNDPATAKADSQPEPAVDDGTDEETGQFGSLEDTFSSDTAINLDQSDPLAEADFHMAYGLYDQAADLITAELEKDPGDQALMAKLCEIYFVWGNRDAFVESATRYKLSGGDANTSEWNKIVIMGRQIAADDELFAGADIAAATSAIDLDLQSADDAGDGSALDMDFGAETTSDAESDILDLGADDAAADASSIDFAFDEVSDAGEAANTEGFDIDATEETPTIAGTVEMESADQTAEMPAPTVESPTIEEQFDAGTTELPSLDENLGQAIADSGQDAEATAEINLDELDLDIGDDDATELASLDDLDSMDIGDTGKNPEIDPSDTGVRAVLEVDDLDELAGESGSMSGLNLAVDETGQSPGLTDDDPDSTDTAIDPKLLDATGVTQVLSEDFAVETEVIGDDEATMLAPMDDDGEFDFAKTEALPADVFSSDDDNDLDDLTSALQASDVGGDTIEQLRDDETVEQPRPANPDATSEVPTMSLGPEEMSDDLNEARTMTEVGTKLDLARAYVDMGDPSGARAILQEVLDEGDDGQKQQAQQLLDSLSE